MKSIDDLISEHAFFVDMPTEYIQTISSCGRNVHFKGGEYIAREGDSADVFYVIRSGHASIEIRTPKEARIIQTLRSGDIAGWNWIFPPYKWAFDLRAIEGLSAITLDGKCLREKCELDTDLGYLLMKKFAIIITERLHATRMQLIDVYGKEDHD